MNRPGIDLPLKQDSALPSEGRKGRWHEVALPVTVRERVIIAITAALKDKPDWERKVFDDTIVDKWRLKALAGNNIMQGQDQTAIIEDGKGQLAELEDEAPNSNRSARQWAVTETLFQYVRLDSCGRTRTS
jgi:hypothetical protein